MQRGSISEVTGRETLDAGQEHNDDDSAIETMMKDRWGYKPERPQDR